MITNISMPGDKYGDGITLIKYIKRHYPRLSIIVLTMNNNAAILSAVFDLDIAGIVLKKGAPTDLPKALAALQKGKKFTPERVAKLLEKISANGYGDKRLSPKESEVTSPVRRGLSGQRDRQETQPQHQDYQQLEEIGDDEAWRRERHCLTQPPVLHKHDAAVQRMIVLASTFSLKSTLPPPGPFAFKVSERGVPHLLAVIGQRLFQHF